MMPRRVLPLAGALVLMIAGIGAPVLADHGGSESAEEYCDRDGWSQEEREECEKQYRQEHNETEDDGDAQAPRQAPDCDSYDDPEQRERCEEARNRTQSIDDDGSDRSGEPAAIADLPAGVAPDVHDRREFYQDQAREHREFHADQRQERRELIENQTAERHAVVADLVDECLNETESRDAGNMSAEELRDRLEARDTNATDECLRDLRAFLMEQHEERDALLEDQRAAHEAFHDDLREQRQSYLEEQRQEAEDRAQERHQEWTERHEAAEERPAAAGSFEAGDGHVDGRYVSFNYTADPAALADVTVKGIPVFDAAALDATATERLRGAGFALASGNGTLLIHDHPAVAFLIQPRDEAMWSLDVADHLSVNKTGDDERWTVTDGDGFTGILRFADDPAYDPVNKTFTGDDPVRFVVLPEDAGSPDVDRQDDDEPEDPATERQREVSHAKREALAEGNLGAEVTLASAENGSVEGETILYDDLEVTLEEAEEGKVRFVVDGELEAGRTVVVNAPPGLFEGDRLAISYEDILENGTTEEVPIRHASSVQDIMNPNDDSTPEYLPAKGADGWQVMVTIPHFSAHAVTIQSVTASAPPSVMAGIVAAVGFLVVAGGNLFRRGGP